MYREDIEGIIIIEPKVYRDDRGFFMESYSKREFKRLGIDLEFVQDNHSKSKKGVLRGLHFQKKFSQGKLIRVISGSVLDIAVDLRRESETYGRYFKILLSSENKKLIYIPPGFAHGFLTLEDESEIEYKCTNYYAPEYDSGIVWNDISLDIDWELENYNLKLEDLILSEKDRKLQSFEEFTNSGVVIEE